MKLLHLHEITAGNTWTHVDAGAKESNRHWKLLSCCDAPELQSKTDQNVFGLRQLMKANAQTHVDPGAQDSNRPWQLLSRCS